MFQGTSIKKKVSVQNIEDSGIKTLKIIQLQIMSITKHIFGFQNN